MKGFVCAHDGAATWLRQFSVAHLPEAPLGSTLIFVEKTAGGDMVAPYRIAPPGEAIALAAQIKDRLANRPALALSGTRPHRIIWQGWASDPLTALQAAAGKEGVDC